MRAPAAEVLLPLDSKEFDAELLSVDTAGVVTFRKQALQPTDAAPPAEAGSLAGELGSIPFGEFVRWGSPAELRPQMVVVLADGGRLVTAAAWAGGAAVRLEHESLVVLSDVFGEVPLPRSLVSGIVLAQRSHPREREKLEQSVRAADVPSPSETSSDLVMLTNNDRVIGTVKELAGGSLELVTDEGQVKLPLSRVEAVVLGTGRRRFITPLPVRHRDQARGFETAARKPSAATSAPKVAVGMDDGSLLFAERLAANEQQLAVLLAGGVKLAGGTVDDLALLQSLGGRRFVYLSDLEPAGYRHVPYLTLEWPYQRDRNVQGGPIMVQGRRYLKGIGMHSASRLTYRLGGQYRRFDAAVALDDSAEEKGSVTFGVYMLRDGAWKEAYLSGVVRGAKEPRSISVDVNGAEGLTLTVDFADRGDELDRAVWLDARLIKNY